MAVPNVLPLALAAEQYGLEYATLRELTNAGVFTKHVFEPDRPKSPIFVVVAELDAWKSGGVEAVIELRSKAKA